MYIHYLTIRIIFLRMWGSMFSHEAQGGNKPQGIDERKEI